MLVEYDPAEISYDHLVNVFFNLHSPTTPPDYHGGQYRSAVFYYSPQQAETARMVKDNLTKSNRFHRPVTTQIVPAPEFWRAEEYHQDYVRKHQGGWSCHL